MSAVSQHTVLDTRSRINKILLLCTGFNGLCQRVYNELAASGYILKVVLTVKKENVEDEIKSFNPDLILCPFLKEKISKDIWNKYICIIIHPGIIGDRGPSSLDWAIQNRKEYWGVTAIQASEEMDAGDIWASRKFPVQLRPKASIYRQEVCDAALECVQDVLVNYKDMNFIPRPLSYRDTDVTGKLQPVMKQADRSIDWQKETAGQIIRKIHAADSFPGVLDTICDRQFYLYGACYEENLRGQPGQIIAKRNAAICRATKDAAIWVSHLREKDDNKGLTLKLPATHILQQELKDVKEARLPMLHLKQNTYQEIYYEEVGYVGYLFFEFHNGAMDTEQCDRLLKAYLEALNRPTRVLVLMGGSDFWSNGIHLNSIENAQCPANEAWDNINAMNNLVEAIIKTDSHIIISALRSNAGAGGAILPLSADYVVMRDDVILNPHYKNMGLYGSEYWTYLLPKRVGKEQTTELTSACLPIGSRQAFNMNMVDYVFPANRKYYYEMVQQFSHRISTIPDFYQNLEKLNQERKHDNKIKELEEYREEELEIMRENFFENNWNFEAKRRSFVYK